MTTSNLDSVFGQADGGDEAPPFWVLGKLAQALAPRCRARNRLGEPCGRPAQAGGEFCYWHTNATRLREARSRRKAVNPKQAHAKVMRSLWRTDPWTPGFTCYLEPEALERLASWLDGHGLRYDWLAPMTQDWLAWKFVNLVRRKCLHEAEGDAVIAELRKRDAHVPDPPADGSAVDMTADSEACAWRPSLILNGAWVEPQPGRRKVVKPVRAAGASGTKRPRQAGKSGAWVPHVGPATLTSLEQREIAHARERDLLAALMDGAPVGMKEVERAQARIEAARRAVLRG